MPVRTVVHRLHLATCMCLDVVCVPLCVYVCACHHTGVCFCIFFVLNMLIWGQKSSGAVPYGTLFALCFLWFGISVPLVFVGSYFGYKKPAPEDPVRTNKIPRQIPEQPWYMNPVFSCLVGGVLPFGAVFIELFFILTSMWLQQVGDFGCAHTAGSMWGCPTHSVRDGAHIQHASSRANSRVP